MNNEKILTIMQKFEVVSRNMARRWGRPDLWEEIYSDMCCAFVRKGRRFADKPLNYVTRACKNDAINNYLRGKSIDSKPRNDVKIVSLESVFEHIPITTRFEKELHLKLLIEKIFRVLTEREKQVASLIMDGYTEREMANLLSISQQRVNCIKRRIKQKARRLLQEPVVF